MLSAVSVGYSSQPTEVGPPIRNLGTRSAPYTNRGKAKGTQAKGTHTHIASHFIVKCGFSQMWLFIGKTTHMHKAPKHNQKPHLLNETRSQEGFEQAEDNNA